MAVRSGPGSKPSRLFSSYVTLSYFSLVFFILVAFSGDCSAKRIEVGGAYPLKSIQEALSLCEDGDSVMVHPGIYKEGELIINKRIRFIGVGKPVLDGELKHALITVRAAGTLVSGFEIRNTGTSDIREVSGIRIDEVNFCVVENNHFYNNFFAVYLSNASFCRVENNRIEGFARSETSSGNGIHLWKGSNNTILSNHISGHRDGIYFEFVKFSSIINNISEKNLRYGLHFMFSDDDIYKYNIFRENGSGVAVMYTRRVLMEHNRFEFNWGSAAYGLLLKDISHSSIRNNLFIRNTTGLYMEGTNSTVIENNDFLKNGWAVRLLGDCYDDTLRSNNFKSNTFDMATNAQRNMNHIRGNYWNQYSGYDLDKDGTGDIPFHPVSFYSKLTEESPHTLMMLHSFFVDLLNQTERVVPTITPAEFRDDEPKMKPIIYDQDRKSE